MNLPIFTWADYVITVVICLSILISVFRGLIREALSLMSWVAAITVAVMFYQPVAAHFTSVIHSESARHIVTFGILFLLTLFIGMLISRAISKLVHSTGLGGTDRVLGTVFGFARGVLIVGLLLVVASVNTTVTNEEWWTKSTFIPHFKPVVTWLKTYLPKRDPEPVTFPDAIPASKKA